MHSDGLERSGQHHRILRPPAASYPVRTGHPYSQGHGIGKCSSHARSQFQQKSHTVFQTAAVFIRAVVGQWRKKLMTQISMGAMQFNDLEPNLHRPPGSRYKCFNNRPDTILIEFPRNRPIGGKGIGRRAYRGPRVFICGQRMAMSLPRYIAGGFAPCMGKLNTKPGRPSPTTGTGYRPAQGYLTIIVIQAQAAMGNSPVALYRGSFHHHQTRPGITKLHQVLKVPVSSYPIHSGILTHRGHHNAIR